MLLAKGKIGKAVVIRTGALGDVLAVRGALAFLKKAFPNAELCLIAPGGRGRFFQREGWAERWFDWEQASFAWLFAEGDAPPSGALRAVFAGADLIVSYLDASGGEDGIARLEDRLRLLAPGAGLVFCPSRPPPGHEMPIGEWLAAAVEGFAHTYRLLPADFPYDATQAAAARIRLPAWDVGDASALPAGGFAVLHPGSGGAAKNWGFDNFAVLGKLLSMPAEERGRPVVDGVVVTSGEADGDLGSRLAAALPGAVHVHMPSLPALAQILAHAALYVGNDSGVSHLAAAVEAGDGRRCRMAVVFGPSDPGVWAPPGALVLPAGPKMDALAAPDAWRMISRQADAAGGKRL